MLLFMCVCTHVQVCNHPDLFERRDVVSPLSLSVPSPSLPRLLHHHIHHGNTHRHRYSLSGLGEDLQLFVANQIGKIYREHPIPTKTFTNFMDCCVLGLVLGCHACLPTINFELFAKVLDCMCIV